MQFTDGNSPDTARSSDRYRWMVVLMLCGICFFNYADRQAIFSVFPLLQKEMHLSPVQLGMLGAAFAWVYGLGAPFAGFIVDRVRRKTAILSGVHIWSIICVATALSRNFRHLLFFMAAEGSGETIYYPASVSLISDYHGKETRSRALGLLVTSVYIGTIGGGFFAGLIGQHYGWRWSFVAFGSGGILLAMVLHRYLREPERGKADRVDAGVEGIVHEHAKLGVGETLKLILRTPTALILMGVFVCANFVAVVLLSWMPAFLYQKFGMSLAMAGLSATLFAQLSSMAGAFTGGWLADVFSRRSSRGRMLVQTIGVFVGAPFVLLCGLTHSLGWLIVALTGWGFFKGLYDANIFASPFDVIRPEARGTMAGLMNCVGWLLGGGTAPIVIGLIAERSSLSFAIAAASGVYIVAGLLLCLGMFWFVERDSAAMRAQVSEQPMPLVP